MVDFGGLRDKAEGFIAENDDKIKDGIGKVGSFVGDKIGHDKVDGIEDKLTGFIDKLAHHDEQPPAAPAAPAPPAAPTEPPAPTS